MKYSVGDRAYHRHCNQLGLNPFGRAFFCQGEWDFHKPVEPAQDLNGINSKFFQLHSVISGEREIIRE